MADHIISLVKDQQAHFAYVDPATGQLIPFADIFIPDEDRFGMAEAAGLGSSLVDFLGLNGSRRPVTGIMTVGQSLEARRRAAALARHEAEQIELPAEPPKSQPKSLPKGTTNVGRPRRDGKPNQTGDPNLKAQAYIPGEWVVEVVNQYPEGINARDIGERIWRTKLIAMSRGGEVEYPRWVTRAVENRITGYAEAHRASGKPVPFITESYLTEGGMKRRRLKPLPTTDTPTDNTLGI